jgi:hypothetical protein
MALEDNVYGGNYPVDSISKIISDLVFFTEHGEPRVIFRPASLRLYHKHIVLLCIAAMWGSQLHKGKSFKGASINEIEHNTCLLRHVLEQAISELERNRYIEKTWRNRYVIRGPALPIIETELAPFKPKPK